MRTLALLLVPSIAFAYDSDVETVNLEARQALHRGVDYTTYWPSADSPVAVKFTADTATEIAVEMAAESQLTWPDALTHRWTGVDLGGLAEFVTETTLSADVHVGAFGLDFDIGVWSDSFEWASEKWFDSLLMPGGPQETIWLVLRDAHFFQVDVDWEVADGVVLTFGLDGDPISNASITGLSVTTNGVKTTDAADPQVLSVPSRNDGSFEVQALWEGQVDANWGVELVPWIRVAVDDWGAVELPIYTLSWELGSDSRVLASKLTTVDHAIPAIDVSPVIDFGDVDVGVETEVDLPIENLGELLLTGTATFEGDAVFRLVDRNFAAEGDGEDTITVRFTPDSEGDFEGTVRITSNDPIVPSVAIPVMGSGIGEDIPLEDGEEPGQGRIRGCGCDAGATSGAPMTAIGLGLLGLVGLRRRRA